MITRRKHLLTAAALAAALALGGCAAGAAPDTTTASDVPVPGGTLTWGITVQPTAGGMDPMVATSIPASVIMNQAYDTLLTRDDSGEILPNLAESWEQPDDVTYVFQLRDDVTFADGTPLTPDDVVYTFETYLEAPTAKKSYISALESAEATGDLEVTLRLSSPDSTFLPALSGPLTFLIVGREGYGNASEDERQTTSFGTGPFQITEWNDGVSITLEKNENYWKDDLPYIDEITFEVIPDETTLLAALQQGSIQAAYLGDGNLVSQAEQGGFVAGDPAYTGLLAIYINPESGPLSDLRVRRAVSLALDRQALVDTAMFGYGAVSTSVAVGDPGAPVPDEDTPYYTRDVEAAKELLAEAGQPSPEIEISYFSDAATSHHPIYELMQQQLAEAGITLTLNAAPLAEIAPVWTAGEHFTDLVSVPASTKTDPVFHHTSFLADGEVLNYWEGNPDADLARELLDELRLETDPDARAALTEELTDEVADKMLILAPMALPVNFEVWDGETLQGYQSDPYNARYRLTESWLAQ